jgi:hypothetical protein
MSMNILAMGLSFHGVLVSVTFVTFSVILGVIFLVGVMEAVMV